MFRGFSGRIYGDWLVLFVRIGRRSKFSMQNCHQFSYSTRVNPVSWDRITVQNLTRTAARKQIQRMWVAGTLGVFFTTLLRSIAVHIQQASLTPNFSYTLELFIRYGYLSLLLIYFFMSNLRIDQSDDRKDLPFDVIQSLASWTTLVALDFVVPGHGFPLGQYWWAVSVANLTIIIIAAFALLWFPVENLKTIRRAGIGCAIASIVVVWLPLPQRTVLLAVAALESGLLAVLAIYVYRRWPTI